MPMLRLLLLLCRSSVLDREAFFSFTLSAHPQGSHTITTECTAVAECKALMLGLIQERVTITCTWIVEHASLISLPHCNVLK